LGRRSEAEIVVSFMDEPFVGMMIMFQPFISCERSFFIPTLLVLFPTHILMM